MIIHIYTKPVPASKQVLISRNQSASQPFPFGPSSCLGAVLTGRDAAGESSFDTQEVRLMDFAGRGV